MEAAADRKEMSQGTREQPLRSWWRGLLFALILVAVTILVYRPAWNGGFLWDDDVYITHNELLTAPVNGSAPKGVLLVFYRGYW